MIQWFRDGCNERWLATIRQIREFLRRDFPQHRLSGGFDVRRLAYVFHLAGQPRARLVVSLKVLRYAWRLEPHLHQ